MKLKFLALVSLALLSSHTSAGIFYVSPTYSPGSEKDRAQTTTSAYAGLVWTFKEKKSLIPDLTLGVRSLNVKSNDQVTGADLSARIKFGNGLGNGLGFDSVRLSYVGGQRTTLGLAGIGYSKTDNTILSTFAVQGAFARLGTDYEFKPAKFSPYIEALTLDNPAKVNKIITPGSYSCPPGSLLYGNLCGFQM